MWSISATNSNGSIYFPAGTIGCRNPNGPCLLMPGANLSMEYTTRESRSTGTILLKDVHNVVRGFSYDTGLALHCPHINPGGRGPVVFNDPGDGDIHIWGRSW
jgi:hypothetical protein